MKHARTTTVWHGAGRRGYGFAPAGLGWIAFAALALLASGCSRPTPARPVSEPPQAAAPKPPSEAGLAPSRSPEPQGVTSQPESTAPEPTEIPPEVATAWAGDRPAPSAGEGLGEGSGDEALATAGAEDERSEAEPDQAAEGRDQAELADGDALSICRDLRSPAAEALGVDPERFSLRASDVEDDVWQTMLDGCQLALDAPGADLNIGERFDTLPAYRLRAVLGAAGWSPDPAYGQVLPGETVDGYTRRGGLCIVRAKVEPPAGQACDGSDPTCGLPPVALDHAIAIRCARF